MLPFVFKTTSPANCCYCVCTADARSFCDSWVSCTRLIWPSTRLKFKTRRVLQRLECSIVVSCNVSAKGRLNIDLRQQLHQPTNARRQSFTPGTPGQFLPYVAMHRAASAVVRCLSVCPSVCRVHVLYWNE